MCANIILEEENGGSLSGDGKNPGERGADETDKASDPLQIRQSAETP